MANRRTISRITKMRNLNRCCVVPRGANQKGFFTLPRLHFYPIFISNFFAQKIFFTIVVGKKSYCMHKIYTCQHIIKFKKTEKLRLSNWVLPVGVYLFYCSADHCISLDRVFGICYFQNSKFEN